MTEEKLDAILIELQNKMLEIINLTPRDVLIDEIDRAFAKVRIDMHNLMHNPD